MKHYPLTQISWTTIFWVNSSLFYFLVSCILIVFGRMCYFFRTYFFYVLDFSKFSFFFSFVTFERSNNGSHGSLDKKKDAIVFGRICIEQRLRPFGGWYMVHHQRFGYSARQGIFGVFIYFDKEKMAWNFLVYILTFLNREERSYWRNSKDIPAPFPAYFPALRFPLVFFRSVSWLLLFWFASLYFGFDKRSRMGNTRKTKETVRIICRGKRIWPTVCWELVFTV